MATLPFQSVRSTTGGSGVSDHGLLTGLADDDHTQYSIISSGAGAPASTPVRVGAIYIDLTSDLVYIATDVASSADWDRLSIHGHVHAAGDITSGTFADARIAQSNVTQHQAAIDHDALTNFVANEHIDWTAASSNFVTTGTGSFTDVVTINGNATQGGRLRLAEDTDNGTNYMELRANSNIGSTFTLTFPADDGTPGQFLKTDGSGILTWDSVTASPGGSNTQMQWNNAGVLAGDTGFTTNGAGSVNIVGDLDVDNLNVNGNTIAATNADGSINLTPLGTGAVVVNASSAKSASIKLFEDTDNGSNSISLTVPAVIGTDYTLTLPSTGGTTSYALISTDGAGTLGYASHDTLADFVANEHIDHTSVSLTAGEGLTGGGDISASRSFALDFSDLSTTDTTVGGTDLLSIHDGSQKKISFSNFTASIDHDALTNFVANEHINWTAASSNFSTTGTGAFTDVVTISGNATNSARLRLAEDTDNGSNYTELRAAASIGSNYTLTFPAAPGTTNYVLRDTDGAGTLGFTDLTGIAGTLGISQGGTGQTSQTAAFDALAPTTTKGDLIVHNGTDNIRVGVGVNGYVIVADSAEASGVKWAVNTPVAGGSNTQLQYNSSGSIAGDTGFTTNGAGSVNITGDLDVDNLNLNGNQLSSTNAGGNIDLLTATTGAVRILGNSTQQGELRLLEDSDNGTNYAAIKTPAAVTTSYTLTLPDGDASAANYALCDTDGSGTLGWLGHNSLQGYVANEHIDWTSASNNFSTSGTISGTSGAVDFNGAASLKIPQSAAPTISANGHIGVDTTVTDFSHGILKYYGGEELGVVAMPIAQFTTPTDGYLVSYNATNDEFVLTAPAAGGGLSIGTVYPIIIGQFSA